MVMDRFCILHLIVKAVRREGKGWMAGWVVRVVESGSGGDSDRFSSRDVATNS